MRVAGTTTWYGKKQTRPSIHPELGRTIAPWLRSLGAMVAEASVQRTGVLAPVPILRDNGPPTFRRIPMKTCFVTLVLAVVAMTALAGCAGSATCNCGCGNKTDAAATPTIPDASPAPTIPDASAGDVVWAGVGSGSGEIDPTRASRGKLAVSNGVPYAAFSDSSASGKLSVMTLTGTKWTNVGTAGFTASSVDQYILYVDNGTPYVAFSGYGSTGSGETMNVMKFDGTKWVAVGNANFAAVGYYPLGLTVSGGVPYVAFSDQNNSLHVQSLVGGIWTDVGGTYVSINGRYPAVTMYNGQPTVVFADSSGTNSYILTLLTFNGTAWVPLATSTLTLDYDYGDTYITVSGTILYITFYSDVYGAVMLKLSGGTLVSVGTLGTISNGSNVESVSGAVYSGTPYVAFDDEARDSDPNPMAATVKYFDGTSWKLFAGYPDSCDIEDTYLVVDQTSGHLYFTYNDCNGAMTVKVQ